MRLFCPLYASATTSPVCLSVSQSVGTKGTLHPLPTLQNNDHVPQFIETGSKPVFFILNPNTNGHHVLFAGIGRTLVFDWDHTSYLFMLYLFLFHAICNGPDICNHHHHPHTHTWLNQNPQSKIYFIKQPHSDCNT